MSTGFSTAGMSYINSFDIYASSVKRTIRRIPESPIALTVFLLKECSEVEAVSPPVENLLITPRGGMPPYDVCLYSAGPGLCAFFWVILPEFPRS